MQAQTPYVFPHVQRAQLVEDRARNVVRIARVLLIPPAENEPDEQERLGKGKRSHVEARREQVAEPLASTQRDKSNTKREKSNTTKRVVEYKQ